VLAFFAGSAKLKACQVCSKPGMKWQYPAALLGILWQLSQEVFLEITV
jgi:hypothetical protein